MSPRRAVPLPLLALLLALVGTVTALPASSPAGAASRWAAVQDATIRPGVQMFTQGAQCTGNFVFTDRRYRVYVGYAAHCAGLGAATDTDGCLTDSVPLGTRVRFANGASPVSSGTTAGRGRLVYSSWVTMRARGETRVHPCAHNDFALVRVGRKHVAKVNPTMPGHGGPVGLAADLVAAGESVHTYGSSSLRPLAPLSAKSGTSLGSYAGGWAHDVYTVTPGVPGDSGSGFLDSDGGAFGTLSTVRLTPFPGSNGLGDLRKELRYAKRHSGIAGLRLVPGTEPFTR